MEPDSAPSFVPLEHERFVQPLQDDLVSLPSSRMEDLIPSWLGRDFEEGRPLCKLCELEFFKLRDELKESKLTQEALESELRWAMEGKLNAELALTEYLTQEGPQMSPPFGMMGPPTSFPRQRGFLNSSPSGKGFVQQQNHAEFVQREKIMDLETCLQRLSSQFQGLADSYNNTVSRLQQVQDENYQLRKEKLELHSNNVELVKGHRVKDRRMQKLMERQGLTTEQPLYGAPVMPLLGLPAPVVPLIPSQIKDVDSRHLDDRSGNGNHHLEKDHPKLLEISELNIKPRPEPGSMAIEGQNSTPPDGMQSVQNQPQQKPSPANTPPVIERSRNYRPVDEGRASVGDDFRAMNNGGYSPDADQKVNIVKRGAAGSRDESHAREVESDRRTSRDRGILSYKDQDHHKKSLSGRLGPMSPVHQHRSPPDSGHVRIKPGGKSSGTSHPKIEGEGRLAWIALGYLDTPADVRSVKPSRDEGASGGHSKMHCEGSTRRSHDGTSMVHTPPKERKRAMSPDEPLGISSPGGVARGTLTPVARPSRKRTPPSEQKLEAAPLFGYEGSDPLVDAAQLDVFNQGTFKTELCNKWEEIGTCPYGNRCQYAHGVGELRPIIRHPRYKTELCRMVATGKECPYGHRCHFRHAMTAEERDKIMWS